MIERWARWLAAGLLLLFWGRLQVTAVAQSVTFDEILHILHGVLFWQSWQLYSVVQNPPLVNALIGLPVQLTLQPAIPLTDVVWQSGDWLRISQQFMWDSNSNGLQIIWVGRQAIMLTAVLLGAVVYRFAGMLFQAQAGGLLALCLYTFDPNILAHSFLATTDLGTAFFFLLAAFAVWRYWWSDDASGWPRYLGTAVAIGLALAAKFSGIILLIALMLLGLYRAGRQQRLEVGGWLILGGLIFLSIYRFQFAPLLDDFYQQQAHQAAGHDAFFMGEVKQGGWWYYFPIIFLIKTPLPTLALMALAVGHWAWWRGWRDRAQAWLLLLVGGVMAAGLASRVNIGYRYLLPILPLLFVFSARVWLKPPGINRSGKMRLFLSAPPLQARSQDTPHKLPASAYQLSITVYGLLALLVIISLAIHPHYLSYFNAIAGGPEKGWQWAVDSNADWGQDIQGLRAYVAANQIDHFYAAWLGSAPLVAYGITQGEPLRVWPIGREDLLLDTFYPEKPRPGVYVLSVTQLQGVYARDPARFAWFRQREPEAKIGYSLFVYDVPETGTAVGLGLSGIGLRHIDPADYTRAFQSNDVQPRWFDGRTSFLWPGGGESAVVWTAVGDGHLPTHPLLQSLYRSDSPVLNGERVVEDKTWRYHLYHWPESPLQPKIVSENVSIFGETLRFLGYEAEACMAGRPFEMLTFWRLNQTSSESELKLFTHFMDEAGNLVSQYDGLDVSMAGLRPGDELAQLHSIPLPSDLPSGIYTLRLGVYNAATLAPLPALVAGLPEAYITLKLFCS